MSLSQPESTPDFCFNHQNQMSAILAIAISSLLAIAAALVHCQDARSQTYTDGNSAEIKQLVNNKTSEEACDIKNSKYPCPP